MWDIIPKTLTFDTTVRYGSSRWIDGDEANSATYKLPAYVVVDLRLGGDVDRFFWSASVQNLFDRQLVDYAVIFAPNFYSAYPLPGRTVMFKAGVKY
jgi:iron complex outermembrane receptor protein